MVAVEQTQYLVLWSRLGHYNPAELDRLTFDEVQLFEYWAHCASIVPVEVNDPMPAAWGRALN